MKSKFLFLSIFGTLAISPMAIIASCVNNESVDQNPPVDQEPPTDQIPPTEDGGDIIETPSELPSDNLPDIEKAMANIKARLAEELSKIHLFKPSELGPVKSSKQPMFNLPFPIQDERQLFGFTSKYRSINDDDKKGEKTIEITLTRGKETHKKQLVINGFLTEEAEKNEKLDHLNPEKVFYGFSRGLQQIMSTNGSILVVIPEKKNINEFLKLTGDQVVNEIKDLLIKNSKDKDKFEVKALRNPVQWKPFWIKDNAVRIDVQIVEKTSAKNQPKKSGIYSVKIMGFAEDKETLYDEKSFNAGVYGFGSFHTPVKYDAKNKKPSEIKTTQELMSQLDLGLTSYVKAQDIELVEGSANDEEGSLKITVRLTSKFNEKWTKWVEMKLYGFAIETN